jgi:hypothetical protein
MMCCQKKLKHLRLHREKKYDQAHLHLLQNQRKLLRKLFSEGTMFRQSQWSGSTLQTVWIASKEYHFKADACTLDI